MKLFKKISIISLLFCTCQIFSKDLPRRTLNKIKNLEKTMEKSQDIEVLAKCHFEIFNYHAVHQKINREAINHLIQGAQLYRLIYKQYQGEHSLAELEESKKILEQRENGFSDLMDLSIDMNSMNPGELKEKKILLSFADSHHEILLEKAKIMRKKKKTAASCFYSIAEFFRQEEDKALCQKYLELAFECEQESFGVF